MPADHLHRRRLDVVFGLFLASGVTVGAYFLWAVADWIHSQGEGAFGLFYLGAFSFIPTLLAGLAGGAHMFRGARESRRTPRGGADRRPPGVVGRRGRHRAIARRPVVGLGHENRHHRRARTLCGGGPMAGLPLVLAAATSRAAQLFVGRSHIVRLCQADPKILVSLVEWADRVITE
jgi:hypothetical protein